MKRNVKNGLKHTDSNKNFLGKSLNISKKLK